MSKRPILSSVLLAIAFFSSTGPVTAGQEPFPLLPGLEPAVEFWKQIFTRFGAAEVVIHDPMDPVTIYAVVAAPEGEAGRAIVARERSRILAELDLSDGDGRVKAQRGVRERFLAGLKASGKYISEMRKIFRAEGLPIELTYLPLVESSFNLHARSSAGAVGVWQFTPETGKRFLKVSKTVDERKDPFEATRAAARLLKENHRILGNWPLAITAYNHGTEGVLRGIRAVGSKNLVDLIRGYRSPAFGYASKNFYAEFLAAVEVATKRPEYFPGLRSDAPLVLSDIHVKRRVAIRALIRSAGVSQAHFHEWNPALNPGLKEVPAGIRLKAPPLAAKRLAASHGRALALGRGTRVAVSRASPGKRVLHRVAPGETLHQIARKYHISPAAIREANGLSEEPWLLAGQRLEIPEG